MNYVKLLSLLTVAAAALMAFASAASATLTEATDDPMEVGDTIHASSAGAVSWTGPVAITCQKSTVHGKVDSNEASRSDILIENVTFEECGNHTVTVIDPGWMSIYSNSRVDWLGFEVTALLHSALLGTVHCIFRADAYVIDIGDITGKTQAVLDVSSDPIPQRTSSSCGLEETLEGSYAIASPHTLLID